MISQIKNVQQFQFGYFNKKIIILPIFRALQRIQSFKQLEMDFTHLQNLLATLQPHPNKIRALVDYILLNTSSNESQIGKSLQKYFYQTNQQKQVALFFTISQILLVCSQRRQVEYFKVFGTKIKSMLQKLSKQVEDIRIMKDICGTLDKWQQEEIFAIKFMQTLKLTVKNFYFKIRQESNQQDKIFGYKKYKKTFLMELNDLKNNPACYQIYQNYCQYIQIEQKLSNLNLQFNKVDFTSSFSQNQIHKNRSEELLKLYNDLRQKLEIVLCKIHRSFNKIASNAKKEYQTIKKDYGIDY